MYKTEGLQTPILILWDTKTKRFKKSQTLTSLGVVYEGNKGLL
jgi:hypothetical protein